MKAVFFCPNLNADVVGLFNNPDQWSKARNRTSVLLLDTPELENWTAFTKNTWANLVAAGAVQKLQDWRIRLALNAGAIKPQYCGNLPKAIQDAVDMISHVETTGSKLDFLSIDSPIYDGLTECNLDLPTSIKTTADYIHAMRAFRPAMQVGMTMSYPSLTVDQWVQTIDTLGSLGALPSFCHFDFNYQLLAKPNYAGALARDLPVLRTKFINKGVPYGVILGPGGPASDSLDWYTKSLANATLINNIIGMPEHCVIESWNQDPARAIPQVLPERAMGTHTKAVNDIMALFC